MIGKVLALALLATGGGEEARTPVENGGVDLLPGRYLMGRLGESGMRRLYPAEALKAGVDGRVDLACRVAPNGQVHSCAVESETPKGQGFAKASLDAVASYQFSPPKGGAAGDVAVRIPFQWRAAETVRHVDRALWIAGPDRATYEAARPASLGDRGGGADLECRVAPDGRLEACRSKAASSPDVASAAIALAQETMRIDLRDGIGMRTPGRLVSTQVAFGWRGPNTPPPLPIGPSRPPRDTTQPLPQPQPPVPVSVGSPPARAPAGSVVTRPEWLRRPTGEDMARYFPEAARSAGLGGRATITCTVRANGTLEACSVISEDPPGMGFGDAALRASRLFKMASQQKDGAPVIGAQIRIPLAWRLPEPVEPPALDAGKAPKTP